MDQPLAPDLDEPDVPPELAWQIETVAAQGIDEGPAESPRGYCSGAMECMHWFCVKIAPLVLVVVILFVVLYFSYPNQ